MAVLPDYSRIDASLAEACEETHADVRALTVFIHTNDPPTAEQSRKLGELGVSVPSRPRRIFTATLSPAQVAALSNEEWIKRLKLSQRLRMLDE